MPKVGGKQSGGVQSVVLALRLVELFVEARSPIGITALADRLGTTKSRIYRHVQTLVQEGYITQAPDSERYQAGPKLVMLGRIVNDNLDLAEAAAPIARELRDVLGHSTVVSQIAPDGVQVLLTFPGRSAVEIGVRRGSVLSYHASAQGRIAMAFGSSDLQERVIRSPLEMFTPRTLVRPAGLIAEVDRVRARGWAVAPDQMFIGLNGLAAPIFGMNGDLVGTLGVLDSTQFLETVPSEVQIRKTVEAAARISEALGYRPGSSRRS
ncbi:DNA-binding IclR family transcriptional regulator [Rhodoligotrophos appendicifer]|uniref:IclR family transcriptional regulator n=1 Tax=Rhodoligotrophos appendicifer TaxID=987056 RepID=UPI0014795591|nr:IclR family transcriptional regulator [Rhodoligotrophos appendicifer]